MLPHRPPAWASRRLREIVAPIAHKSRRGVDDCLGFGSRGGTTPLSRGIFGTNLDIFECNGKQMWIDLKSGWCHLCQEPIGSTVGNHISERDHMNLAFFLHLFANYPRQWDPRRALQSVGANLYRYATNHLSIDHLHTVQDARRRGELEALIMRLTEGPRPALSHVLQGKSHINFWYSGEHMFRVHVAKMCALMFPAMSAGVLTSFEQKCWGRSNMERLYDALHIASMQRSFGVDPSGLTTKEQKAFFTRSVLWELENATQVRDDLSDVDYVMAISVKRRVSFECVFLQSMMYMNRIINVVQKLEFPSADDLQTMNFT